MWLIAIFVGLGMIAFIVPLTPYGRQVQANLDALVEQENRTICAKLGFEPDSGRYMECVSALSEVRANHSRRIEDPFF